MPADAGLGRDLFLAAAILPAGLINLSQRLLRPERLVYGTRRLLDATQKRGPPLRWLFRPASINTTTRRMLCRCNTIGMTRRLLNFLWRESGASGGGKPGFGGFLPHRQMGNDHTNVRNERRDTAGEAFRGTSARWRG